MPLSVNYTGQSKIFSSNKLTRYTSLSRLDSVSNIKLRNYKSNIGFELKNELGVSGTYSGSKAGDFGDMARSM